MFADCWYFKCADAAGFHQWATGSITSVFSDSDLTDIYFKRKGRKAEVMERRRGSNCSTVFAVCCCCSPDRTASSAESYEARLQDEALLTTSAADLIIDWSRVTLSHTQTCCLCCGITNNTFNSLSLIINITRKLPQLFFTVLCKFDLTSHIKTRQTNWEWHHLPITLF